MRIVTYHRRDNIIHFGRASLFSALTKRPATFGGPLGPVLAEPDTNAGVDGHSPKRWHAIELRTANDEWLPHDMPLFLDSDWNEILYLIWRALGMTSDMERETSFKTPHAADLAGAPSTQLTLADRARALFSARSASGAAPSSKADPAYHFPHSADKAEVGAGTGAYARML